MTYYGNNYDPNYHSRKKTTTFSTNVTDSVWMNRTRTTIDRYCNNCDSWVGYKEYCPWCHSLQTQNSSLILRKKYRPNLRKEWIRIKNLNEEDFIQQQKEFKYKNSCFIATAAFGTTMEPEVQTLRNFRDNQLLTNKAGKTFVKYYYMFSPPIADVIAKVSSLRFIVRIILLPLIKFVK